MFGVYWVSQAKPSPLPPTSFLRATNLTPLQVCTMPFPFQKMSVPSTSCNSTVSRSHNWRVPRNLQNHRTAWLQSFRWLAWLATLRFPWVIVGKLSQWKNCITSAGWGGQFGSFFSPEKRSPETKKGHVLDLHLKWW